MFYEKLYTKNTNLHNIDLNNHFQQHDVPKLTNLESENLEGLISFDEASLALKSMKNNKSPGSDGFSSEFFKFFWKQLGHFVVRSINYGFDMGELSTVQKEGIIICIPKENKPKQLLKNWRPIPLLNVVYKIASTSIANRLKKVLDKLISKEQTGFMPGRYIGENTRLIYDILNYTEKSNIPGLLLFIDFEKAFDSVSWAFIDNVLNYFNFGSSLRKWIEVLYNNIKSRINIGGHLSEYFYPGRGCRQGDPVSSYLFILCAEILSIKIRNEPRIKGISIDRLEFKISQYADDTSLLLDGSEESLNVSLNLLKWFEGISGLKVNFEKTQVIWIGSKRYSNDKLCKHWGLQWGKQKFTLLGIDYDINLDKICEINYRKKLLRIKTIVKQWDKRKLTPLGRISIIKSLLISQFNHLFLSLPNPSQQLFKELNNTIFDFLWDHKNDKLKRDVVTQNYGCGGLNMIDLKAYISALKSTWIRRILNSEGIWQNILAKILDIKSLLQFGIEYLNKTIRNLNNTFWKDVLNAWKELQIKENLNQKHVNLAYTSLWFNNEIKVNRAFVFYKHWAQKNIIYINDLLCDEDRFFSYEEFMEKFNMNINFLEYNGLISSIKNTSLHIKIKFCPKNFHHGFCQKLKQSLKIKKDLKVCTWSLNLKKL